MRLTSIHRAVYYHLRAKVSFWRDGAARRSLAKQLADPCRIPYFSICGEGVGLFAQLYWCLVIWDQYEGTTRIPVLRCTSKNYAGVDGDWLGYLTGRSAESSENGEWIQIDRFEQLPFYAEARPLDFARAAALVSKHFCLSPELKKRVDSLEAQHFEGKRVLGVHYRGTDKRLEAARCPYADFITQVLRHLEQMDSRSVFLATDEGPFSEALRVALPSDVELIVLDHSRSENESPLHQQTALKGEEYRLATEALIDAWMLSRCERLVKTPSMLSGWAKVFRPDLDVYLVGKLYENRRFFPDCLLEEDRLLERRE